MCGICGCADDTAATIYEFSGDEHVHADGTRHSHPALRQRETFELHKKVLAKNDAFAEKTRAWFRENHIFAVNIVSAPGAGKTRLLERTISALKTELGIYVIEGDQATANDSDRVRAAGARAVQVNTGTGCHLEADMVARGVELLAPPQGSLIIVENVGNLVCPALFDLGENTKVAILSTTEGEDKPLKYPHIFQAADLVLLNKIDLMPYLNFDADLAEENARTVNPAVEIIRVSAQTGEGMEAWYRWLHRKKKAARTQSENTALDELDPFQP